MRVTGQSHAKVISNDNLKKRLWGHIYYHYQVLAISLVDLLMLTLGYWLVRATYVQGLAEYVDHTNFESTIMEIIRPCIVLRKWISRY